MRRRDSVGAEDGGFKSVHPAGSMYMAQVISLAKRESSRENEPRCAVRNRPEPPWSSPISPRSVRHEFRVQRSIDDISPRLQSIAVAICKLRRAGTAVCLTTSRYSPLVTSTDEKHPDASLEKVPSAHV
ncbi:hypothetical protein M011DRAFT_472187 [Sporormia fimetaria CBS 119925]|uniref:Uncharacterized protein n=1 Tax=Sporormia fimetaria CBS 119925 TaxID=1340428 RepID=A0A6A6UW35_9PLEO|nr:hypothetical protein M011DRAFT_472187 [Sporormia fimetaria CBS 119925]